MLREIDESERKEVENPFNLIVDLGLRPSLLSLIERKKGFPWIENRAKTSDYSPAASLHRQRAASTHRQK